MAKLDNITLSFQDITTLSEGEVLEILSIRNQKSIRDNMYTNHEIKIDEHLSWVDRLRHSNSAKFYAVKMGENIVGGAGISEINLIHKRADWAFYISNDFHGLGIGSALEYQFVTFVFGNFDIEKLNCEVIEFNDKVIAMHERFGFIREGLRREHVIRDGKKYGVVILGITKKEWSLQDGLR